MLSEKELESQLESLKADIDKKSKALKAAEDKHAETSAKYEADQSRLNEADMVIAHSDVVNLRAELFLLKQRQELFTRQLENLQEQSGPSNG